MSYSKDTIDSVTLTVLYSRSRSSQSW